jgi:hypothetical protein
LWHKWDENERHWKNLLTDHDPVDRALFFSSTYIIIGNGNIMPFWEARWLHGTAPKVIAPNLFKQTRFKNRNVSTEMKNHAWIRCLGEINSPALLEEYIMLFVMLNAVSLTAERDVIVWRWSANGKYSAASAYNCQLGASTFFPADEIWKAKTEPKCKFFAWLVMHNKALTSDNMIKKKWPCNAFCSLCFCQEETAEHLLTRCNYTEALWNAFSSRLGLPRYDILPAEGGPREWVRCLLTMGNKRERKKNLGYLFTFWWHIWKERNHRI